jgi:hypothetical protein
MILTETEQFPTGNCMILSKMKKFPTGNSPGYGAP